MRRTNAWQALVFAVLLFTSCKPYFGGALAGILGGGLGGQLLNMIGIGTGTEGALDIGSIISNIASGGGVGGGILMAIIGWIRKVMAKT